MKKDLDWNRLFNISMLMIVCVVIILHFFGHITIFQVFALNLGATFILILHSLYIELKTCLKEIGLLLDCIYKYLLIKID